MIFIVSILYAHTAIHSLAMCLFELLPNTRKIYLEGCREPAIYILITVKTLYNKRDTVREQSCIRQSLTYVSSISPDNAGEMDDDGETDNTDRHAGETKTAI